MQGKCKGQARDRRDIVTERRSKDKRKARDTVGKGEGKVRKDEGKVREWSGTE